jgi:hypothetical protein
MSELPIDRDPPLSRDRIIVHGEPLRIAFDCLNNAINHVTRIRVGDRIKSEFDKRADDSGRQGYSAPLSPSSPHR